MLRNYGLVYYDNEDGRTHFIPFLTKKEVRNYINAFDMGKDCVSSFSIVKMVESWNAYDGIIYPYRG